MLVVLSPAKTLDYDTPTYVATNTQPDFIEQSSALIDILRLMSPSRIGSLMRISDQLAALNADRYATWSTTFTKRNAKQAVLAFNGDVYEGLDAPSLTAAQLKWRSRICAFYPDCTDCCVRWI